MGSVFHTDARTGSAAGHAAGEAAGVPDCRNCGFRSRCITYGWVSPGGLWFENAVVLRPKPGCRGYVGRGADILDHFGEPHPERATLVEPSS